MSVDTEPPQQRAAAGTRRYGRNTLIRVMVFVAVFGSWELYGRTTNRALFAPVSEVLVAMRAMIADGSLPRAVGVSGSAFLVGFLLAAVVGIATGILMGRSRVAEHMLSPYVSFLYAVPGVAVIPLLVIWFGIGNQLRLAIVFLSCVFSIIINTMQGAKHVDPDLLDVATANCANEAATVRTVVAPHTLPYIFTGLQVGLAEAVVGVIVAEITAVVTGLGGLIISASNMFQTARMLVAIITVGVVSMIVTWGMKRLRRVLMPWEP